KSRSAQPSSCRRKNHLASRSRPGSQGRRNDGTPHPVGNAGAPLRNRSSAWILGVCSVPFRAWSLRSGIAFSHTAFARVRHPDGGRRNIHRCALARNTSQCRDRRCRFGSWPLLSFATHRALTALLFGISPLDLNVYAAAAAVLTISALTAVLIPALRAARMDPAIVLRDE